VTHVKLQNDLSNISLPGYALWNSYSLCALKPECWVPFPHHFKDMSGKIRNTKAISWPFHIKTSSSTWVILFIIGLGFFTALLQRQHYRQIPHLSFWEAYHNLGFCFYGRFLCFVL